MLFQVKDKSNTGEVDKNDNVCKFFWHQKINQLYVKIVKAKLF